MGWNAKIENARLLASSPGPSPASALGAHSLVEGPGNIGLRQRVTRHPTCPVTSVALIKSARNVKQNHFSA